MLKILLVDDEPIFRMGLRTGIQWNEIGCKIVGEAKNGEDALIQIEEKNPDLVFLDIKMPKMDGIEVLKKLKKMKQNPQIIVLSCFNEYEYVREAMKLGACDYLFKPLMESENIVAVIKEVTDVTDLMEDTMEKQGEQISLLMENLLAGLDEEKTLDHLRQIYPTLGKKTYFVMAAKIPGNTCTDRKKDALLNLTQSILMQCVEDEDYPFFCKQDQILYGLFFGQKDKEYGFTRKKELWQKVREYAEVPVWIGSSRNMERIEELPIAFAQAKKAMEVHFFSCFSRKSEEFIEYLPEFAADIDYATVYKAELEELQRSFGECDLDKIKQIQNKICTSVIQKRFFSEKDFSHMMASSIVVNMRLYKYRNILEQLIMEKYDVISELYHQETLEDACVYYFNLLEQIFEKIKKSMNVNSRTDAITHAVEYVQGHYEEKISLTEIAEKVNMSDKYFCKLFKETTGETFVEYLTNVRIQAAKEMLEKMDMKIYEIAERVGFADYHHFCKTFKKVTGQTPKEIRMEMLKKIR